MKLDELMVLCRDKGATDLHLVNKEPPILRIDGKLVRTSLPSLDERTLQDMLYGILSEKQREQFARLSDVDFAITVPEVARFRVNIHRERGAMSGAFRRLPLEVPMPQDLGLPPAAINLARKPNGLVLVTGPVGMGKSTTLAALVNMINVERECLIISIEDPIEYLHTNKTAVIKQREVTIDTPSFADALRHALRQDPNVIVVGEMRDLETISIALTAAETGHLVLATLHTAEAAQTIQRIIDVFPAAQQAQVRLQVADSLRGIVAQLLLPKASGHGLVLATEILVATQAIRNLIREHEIEQIPAQIETGHKYGMQTMDRSLKDLARRGQISYELARLRSRDSDEFDRL